MIKSVILFFIIITNLYAQKASTNELIFMTEDFESGDSTMFTVSPVSGYLQYEYNQPNDYYYLITTATSCSVGIKANYDGAEKGFDVSYSYDGSDLFYTTKNKVTIKNAYYPYTEYFYFYINYLHSDLADSSTPIDLTVRYNEDDDAAYYYAGVVDGANLDTEDMELITQNTTVNIWSVHGDTRTTEDFELYTTIYVVNNHPHLEWNPYHVTPSHYHIWKKDGSAAWSLYQDNISSGTTSYTDDAELIYSAGNPKKTCRYKIAAHYSGSETLHGNEVSKACNDGIEKDDDNLLAETIEYKLHPNYPNPFNPKTIITYQIPNNKFVSLKVYNLLGKEVTILIDESQEAGEYSVSFDGGNLPSGVYLYSLRAGNYIETKKMLLMK